MNAVETASNPNVGLPRIIVAAPMKSGSSYVAAVIDRYFDIKRMWQLPGNYDWTAEHNLTSKLTDFLRGRAFSFNLHMMPHPKNIATAVAELINVFVIWRNIGDMIVSLDDHFHHEAGNGPAFFVLAQEHYVALPAGRRQLVCIDQSLSWYLRFYLAWRRAGVMLHAYENMVVDEQTFFGNIIGAMLTDPPVREILDNALTNHNRENERFNVGIAGRSAHLLEDVAKREIETRILRHPDAPQLEILLWEVPWAVPALAPRHPYDGTVVRAAGESQPYFISRGRRYPIARQSWLASRTGDRRTPREVEPATFMACPLGEPLL